MTRSSLYSPNQLIKIVTTKRSCAISSSRALTDATVGSISCLILSPVHHSLSPTETASAAHHPLPLVRRPTLYFSRRRRRPSNDRRREEQTRRPERGGGSRASRAPRRRRHPPQSEEADWWSARGSRAVVSSTVAMGGLDGVGEQE